MAGIRLIAGLGNPGPRYQDTRHNVGERWVASLAARHGVPLREERKFKGRVGRGTLLGHDVWLLLPDTYMNLSGEAVALLVPRHGITSADRIVVVQDEVDLPVGRLKVKQGGGHAGHNGLRNIDQHLGTRDYVRVRIGVGRPQGRQAGRDHVLKRPGKDDRAELNIVVEEAADAVECYLAHGLNETMTRYNRKDDR